MSKEPEVQTCYACDSVPQIEKGKFETRLYCSTNWAPLSCRRKHYCDATGDTKAEAIENWNAANKKWKAIDQAIAKRWAA